MSSPSPPIPSFLLVHLHHLNSSSTNTFTSTSQSSLTFKKTHLPSPLPTSPSPSCYTSRSPLFISTHITSTSLHSTLPSSLTSCSLSIQFLICNILFSCILLFLRPLISPFTSTFLHSLSSSVIIFTSLLPFRIPSFPSKPSLFPSPFFIPHFHAQLCLPVPCSFSGSVYFCSYFPLPFHYLRSHLRLSSIISLRFPPSTSSLTLSLSFVFCIPFFSFLLISIL